MVDAKLCPLCGEPNACARAKDPECNDCWCCAESFPRSLLEQVPDEARCKACICRSCVIKTYESDSN